MDETNSFKALARQDIDKIFDRAAKALGVKLVRPRAEDEAGAIVEGTAFEGRGEIMYYVMYSFSGGEPRVTLMVGKPLSFSPTDQIAATFAAKEVAWEDLANALVDMRRSLS